MSRVMNHSRITRAQFTELCGEFFIDDAMALEDEALRKALKEGQTYEEIRTFFIEQF
tara:strand:- start:182 stop:352 length:171 start_codon:yes stop_codon:yes gene_type:complete